MQVLDGKAKPSVVFLASTLPTGGAEKMFVGIAEGLKTKGFQVRVVCLKEAGELGSMVMQSGVELIEGVMAERASVSGFLRLCGILRKLDPAILYVLDHRNAVVAGTLASILLGVKGRLVAVHSTRLWGGRKSLQFPIPLLLPFVEKVIAVSDSQREYLSSEEGIPLTRMKVVRNGIDLSAFRNGDSSDSMRTELNIPKGVPIVGCVAGLRPEKGHFILFSAAKELLSTFGDCIFLLVGSGTMSEELKSEAQRLGIASNVIFAGRRENVPELLRLMDVFVLPSLPVVETAPLSVMEAMACGRAVVATDVGSLREIVEDGATGLLVPPGDSHSLALALKSLLADSAKRKEMGRMGKERAAKEFDFARVVDETECLFEEILSG
ncbi:MAG: glycosyltransferase [Candidatus Eisenbacteria bacterium]|nr:glycosyltransferase [Candidatus Eisenbacteria bacterium]